ncbi:MAG TPA: hypothetical protein VMA95_03615 [Streptosporangiaceae bacterium]|nr:hypothetical protein [Streptosporangiaceae bacterium]
MLARIKAFGEFAYDFVIGDDWLVAAGVVVALGITFALAHVMNVTAWWLVPAILLVLLPLSLWRATRGSRPS